MQRQPALQPASCSQAEALAAPAVNNVCHADHDHLATLQEEYAREGIDWSYVEFIDNQDCLDLLEGSANAPAMAVFPLIDEACRLPRATYQVWSFLHKAVAMGIFRHERRLQAGLPYIPWVALLS